MKLIDLQFIVDQFFNEGCEIGITNARGQIYSGEACSRECARVGTYMLLLPVVGPPRTTLRSTSAESIDFG